MREIAAMFLLGQLAESEKSRGSHAANLRTKFLSLVMAYPMDMKGAVV